MNVAQIPPSRIVLLGQSLGTAVASAVALHFAAGSQGSKTLPTQLSAQRPQEPISFAGLALIAPFTSLPELLKTYRLGGVIPLLSPLRPYPYLQKLLTDKVVDTWKTEARLAELVKVSGGRRLMLQLLHAKNDYDISWRNSESLFRAIVEAAGGTVEKRVTGKTEAYVEKWDAKDGRELRLDVLAYGGESCRLQLWKLHNRLGKILCANAHTGHNRLVTQAPVALAVLRAFGMSDLGLNESSNF